MMVSLKVKFRGFLEKPRKNALKLAKKPEDPRKCYFEALQIVEFENLENRGQGLQ